MNEAERFLLDNWEEARHLEQCMADVRKKYKGLCQDVVAAVTESHPGLDAPVIEVTRSSLNGWIGFGRKSWPGGDSVDPPGLYVVNLRLDVLASEASKEPESCLWVDKTSSPNLAAAREIVVASAKELVGQEEFDRICTVGSEQDLLEFVNTPSKSDLQRAFCDGDGQRFVDLLRSHFDSMARFVPALDTLFQKPKKT